MIRLTLLAACLAGSVPAWSQTPPRTELTLPDPQAPAPDAARAEQERLLRRMTRLERLLNANEPAATQANRIREREILEDLRRLEQGAEATGDTALLTEARRLRTDYLARRNHDARGDELPVLGNDSRGRVDGARLYTIRLGAPPAPAAAAPLPEVPAAPPGN